ncbi:hypothetical protein GW17_00034746 [Ensete ventricosum]|nr:hypothetical protein GW17_00034746 [Ensete ventricosum]
MKSSSSLRRGGEEQPGLSRSLSLFIPCILVLTMTTESRNSDTRDRDRECTASNLFHPEASRKKEASPHDLGGPPAIAGCPTVEQGSARVELDRRLFSRLFPKPMNSCVVLIDPTAAGWATRLDGYVLVPLLSSLPINSHLLGFINIRKLILEFD